MISVNNNTKLLNGIVSIERDYQDYFGNEFAIDYEHLYKKQFDTRLSRLCSSLHHQLIENLRAPLKTYEKRYNRLKIS